MKLLIGALSIALLAGCSTNQTSYEQAKPAPSDRVIGYQKSPSGEYGDILVTRDGGVMGSGCYLAVFVNGSLAARLAPGERVKFMVPAGDNLVGSGADPKGNGLCAISGVTMREVSASIRPGETKRFRISGDMNAGFVISPSSF